MECCVCSEKKMTVFTKCKHPICHNCLVKSGNLKCPLCRDEMKNVSDDLKDLTDFVKMQRDKIVSLENEIELLRSELKIQSYEPIVPVMGRIPPSILALFGFNTSV